MLRGDKDGGGILKRSPVVDVQSHRSACILWSVHVVASKRSIGDTTKGKDAVTTLPIVLLKAEVGIPIVQLTLEKSEVLCKVPRCELWSVAYSGREFLSIQLQINLSNVTVLKLEWIGIDAVNLVSICVIDVEHSWNSGAHN